MDMMGGKLGAGVCISSFYCHGANHDICLLLKEELGAGSARKPRPPCYST